jgi:hypothetical protein
MLFREWGVFKELNLRHTPRMWRGYIDVLFRLITSFFLYEAVYKIFWTDDVKIIKLTVRPVGRHHPRSSTLPHVDTGSTVYSFGTLPGRTFLSECQARSAIRPGCP